jgi:hypothetical protein
MAALCFLVLLAALTADTVLQAHRFGRDLELDWVRSMRRMDGRS